jgi:hypothetical protein
LKKKNDKKMATIEDLYKYFGVLADAKDEAGKVIFNPFRKR